MFLKLRKSAGKTYASIAESYWENGICRHRTLGSFGIVDSYSKDQLANIGFKLLEITGKSSKSLDVESMTELRRFNWGATAVCKKLWSDFKFSWLLDHLRSNTKIQFPLEESIFKIVSTRLCEPMSKLSVFNSQDLHSDAARVDLQHIYRSLDFLCEHKDDIEQHIYEINRNIFHMTVDVVFYDVTTLHFESTRADEFKDFGYSKDCKFGEVQVVLGMIMNAEGRPIGFEYFPGNTFEGSTLVKALTKLKERFKINRVIVVADRGMNSKINLKSIREMGFDYIISSRLKCMSKDVKSKILDLDSYSAIDNKKNDDEENENEVFKIKEIEYENVVKTLDEKTKKFKSSILKERLICTWSQKRALKDAKDRERMIEKAKTLIATPSKMKDRRGAKKFVKTENENSDDASLVLDETKIKQDSMWDGYYGIQTSDESLNHDDIMSAYKNLWRIEEIFRTLKSTLEMRPMFHWTPKRIKGHMVACFLSFVFERTIELKVLEKKNIHLSSLAIQKELYSLQASEIEIENKKIFLRSTISKQAQQILSSLDVKAFKNSQVEI